MAQHLDHLEQQSHHAPSTSTMSIPPPSPTTRPLEPSTKSPLEEMNACLGNLFFGPSQGIEQAFKLVLGLIQQQDEKYKSLAGEHEEVRQQNSLLLENMKGLQESSFVCLEKLKQSEEIVNAHQGVALEVKELQEHSKQIKEVQSQAGKDLDELKEEVKVMAFNLQLDHGEDLDLKMQRVESEASLHSQGEQRDASSDVAASVANQEAESGIDSKEHAKEETATADDGNLEIDVPIGDGGDGSVGEETFDTHSSQENDDPSSQTKTELEPQVTASPQQVTRRKSVLSSKKLRDDETLASRLGRLEKDKIALQTEMIEIKEFLANLGSYSDKMQVFPSDKSLADVKRRVSMVEGFLSGFGAVYNEDLEPREEIINMQIAATAEAPGFVDSDVSDCDTDELSHGVDKDEFESLARDRFLHVETSENDVVATMKQLESVSSSSDEAVTNKDHPASLPPPSDLQDIEDSKATDVPSPIGQSLSDTESSKPSEEVATILEHQNSFAKQKGLFLHLLDQESRFKENMLHISSRLSELESSYEGRVSRRSMEAYIALNTIREEAVASDSEPIAASTVDAELPPMPSQELALIRSSIEQMTKELDSKISMELLQKEIESYLFQTTATTEDSSRELGRPATPGLTEESLRQFKTSIQQQLQFLNDKKVDRETLLKELSKKGDRLSEEFNIALSTYESQTIESLNNMNYDVNECKASIQDLENQSHNTDPGSFDTNVNIDERIRDATDAVQSNINAIISSRLEGLKAVEDEMENVASQLAEKPDQSQINKMLQDLESSVLKHVGVDDSVKSALANVKTDLNQKLTKEQVLGLVKQLLRGAKEGIAKNNSGSLMVGYKCIGCNEVHQGGVNKSMAAKVNHNALPLGRAVAPPVFPYCRSLSDARLGYSNSKRNLAPLIRRPSFGTFGYRGPRPRPRTSPNQIMHRNTR